MLVMMMLDSKARQGGFFSDWEARLLKRDDTLRPQVSQFPPLWCPRARHREWNLPPFARWQVVCFVRSVLQDCSQIVQHDKPLAMETELDHQRALLHNCLELRLLACLCL